MDPTIAQVYEQIKLQHDFFEKAKLIGFLNKDKQIPLKKIGEEVNIKPSYLCHILRLKKLPPLVIDGYYSQLISISHLFIISRLKDESEMIKVYEKVLSDSLTVNDTENLIREILYDVKNEGESLPKEQIISFIDLIEKRAGFKAKLIQTRTKGKLTLEIKGSRAKTTPILEDLVKLIKSWLGEDSY